MKLRPYQIQAVEAIETAFEKHASALLVMATGLGKTAVAAAVMARRYQAGRGRACLVAHRGELVDQAAATVRRFGIEADVDIADRRAVHDGFRVAPVVCATVQTLTAGTRGRLRRMDPRRFGLLVIDEAHHAVASTWRHVVDHFDGNATSRILGATATPDRSDQAALRSVFETVAFRYDIVDGIRDGWLVPIRQSLVNVDGLDFSAIRTTAGDLNGADLARVLEYEETLHRMMVPTVEIAGDRRTIVFAATVSQARRLAEIANRLKPGSAAAVDGSTPMDARGELFRRFSAGELQFLVNVGIATEGWDDAATDGRGVQLIAMMRPTKSRSLYTQMAGRGLRPLPRTVDLAPDADARRDAIRSSAKTGVLILDFVGNAGRHRLVSAADALGAQYDDRTRNAVARRVSEAGERRELDILEELDAADRLAKSEAESARRRNVVVGARYRTAEIDPFAFVGIAAPKVSDAARRDPITDKQRATLIRNNVPNVDRLCKREASALIDRIFGRPSDAQAWFLRRHGYEPSQYDRKTAGALIGQIKAGNAPHAAASRIHEEHAA